VGHQLDTQVVHPPADGDAGCLTCHGAHSTGHPGLLTASTADTCLTCHDGDSRTFADTHLGFEARTLDCAECHDPHASQMEGMLLPEVHMPFAGGDCSVCHADAQGDTP
jgi:predicted CXXCH cytochrome family protein